MENEIATADEPVDLGYKIWLSRFTKILSAYRAGLIKENELAKFQMFLLLSGQFNANFTSVELTRLGYPKFPFAAMHKNDYLRCTTTSVMEILSQLYLEQSNCSVDFRPIWVDSREILDELGQYNRVIKINDFQFNIIETLISNMKEKSFLGKKVIFQIVNNQNKSLEEFMSDIDSGLLSSLDLAVKKQAFKVLPKKLHALFKLLIESNDELLDDYNSEILAELDSFFPLIKQDNNKKHNNRVELISDVLSSDEPTKQQKTKLWGMFRQELSAENLMRADVINNIESIKPTLRKIQKSIKPTPVLVSAYKEPIKQWIKKNISEYVNYFIQNSVFCFTDIYHDVNAIVIINSNEDFSTLSDLINSLGCRADAINVTQALIKAAPNLFIDEKQTKEIWRRLMSTTMIDELPEVEKNDIESVGKNVTTLISSEGKDSVVTDSQAKEIFVFDGELKELLDSLSCIDVAFQIYAKFITQFLVLYKKHSVEDCALRYILDEEIKSILEEFIEAQHDNDLPKAINCAQLIAEIMNLWIYEKKQKKPLLSYYQEKFPGIAIQSVTHTTYAMRAYAQILNLLEKSRPNSAPLNIFVSNQSYYELLLSFEILRENLASVTLVQTLGEVNESADIIFIEFHQNNVVAGQQFRHSVETLIDSMSTWKQKTRTIIIDATLNMFNDDEVINLLTKSRLLVENKWLKLIFMQSLTKFCQIGLDLRSGGLITEVCHEETASHSINHLSSQITNPLTQKYFDFFIMHNSSLLSSYIEQIRHNCNEVYKEVLTTLDSLEMINPQYCQLVICSDRSSCYVGLKFRGLLLEADKNLKYNSKCIEDFLSLIAEKLLVPLCEHLKLPLTERLSIGFPLSSVNIALDCLRFTVGLENKDQLDDYAKILSYIIYIINNLPMIDIFSTEKKELFSNYFTEKVKQFAAVHCEKPYGMLIQPDSNSPHFYLEINKHDVKFSTVVLESEKLDNSSDNTIKAFYKTEDNSYEPRDFEKPIDNDKLIYACLYSRHLLVKKTDHHYYPIKFCVSNDKLIYPLTFFTAINDFNQILYREESLQEYLVTTADLPVKFTIKKQFDLFGPFKDQYNDCYLALGKNDEVQGLYFFIPGKIQRWVNTAKFMMFYPEGSALVKKGNLLTKIHDMPFTEFQYFMYESSYQPGEKTEYTDQSGKPIELTHHYQPTMNSLSINYQENTSYQGITNYQLILEHDFICHQGNGTTVYKRIISDQKTAIEIDFWSIKDPAQARLLSLMIVAYVREKYKINFIARDHHLIHYLFEISAQESDKVFEHAVQIVYQCRLPLMALLYESFFSNAENYLFSDSTDLVWPSGNTGIDRIKNKQRINRGIKIIESYVNEQANMNATSTALQRRGIWAGVRREENFSGRGVVVKPEDGCASKVPSSGH